MLTPNSNGRVHINMSHTATATVFRNQPVLNLMCPRLAFMFLCSHELIVYPISAINGIDPYKKIEIIKQFKEMVDGYSRVRDCAC